MAAWNHACGTWNCWPSGWISRWPACLRDFDLGLIALCSPSTLLPDYQICSLYFPTRQYLQLCLHHLVKRPQVVAFTLGKAAVDLHGGKEFVSGDGKGQGGELLSGIGINAPVADKAAADDLAKVAAP